MKMLDLLLSPNQQTYGRPCCHCRIHKIALRKEEKKRERKQKIIAIIPNNEFEVYRKVPPTS
jgi:hypothetical protein